jgi:methanogenic corrinoid protein MtbC1
MGKDLVSTLFAVGGFDVKDLGVDVDPKVFIEEAEAMGADIIAVSSLMSTTMPNQKQVIDFLEAKGLREKYIVMIGGGPCTAEYAETIGADGFGKDAVEAVAVARQLLAQK